MAFFQDLRFAFRSLLHSPGYTVVALLTLVLGIGANAAVFALVDGVLLTPLEFPEPARLVRVNEVNAAGREMRAAWRNFEDWRGGATRFEGIAAMQSGYPSTVLGASEPARAVVSGVSDGYFRTLRVAPALGRPLLPEDHRFGAAPVAIVSDAFWRTHLGATRDIGARPLVVGGFSMQVVGVMPPGFSWPRGVDIWHPIELERQSDSRTAHNFVVVGRLAPGATPGQADAELDAVTARFAGEAPPDADAYFARQVSIAPLRESVVGDVRRPLLILLGAALLVLLVACTNLASTTLARGTSREHELAVRHALGAGRDRLLLAAFGEVLALSIAGAVAGVALAWALLRALPSIAPAGLPRLENVHLDARVVGFSFLVSLLAAALSGVLPGLRVVRGAIGTLRGGARSGGDARRQRVWKWLIGCETALALVLLIGSGLLLRSFRSVLDVDPGFQSAGVLTATLDPPPSRYADNEAKRLYWERVSARLRALPGVEVAGLASSAPLDPAPDGVVAVDGGPAQSARGEYLITDAAYFEALGIPLLRGRFFDERDGPDADHVVVVNRAFARQAWPGEDPIGKRITGGGMDDYYDQQKWATVIGEVGDIRQSDITAPPTPSFYFPYRQRPFRSWSMSVVLRSASGDPAALAPALRAVVREVDPEVPLKLETMRARLTDALGTRRFLLLVVVGFGAVALVLAGIGVYGVVAWAVARRRREIGIRLALGAEPRAVRAMMQREYMLAAGIGGAVGIVLALGLTRLMSGLLYEVRPTDPATFIGVIGVLGSAAWLASFISSFRGTRVPPRETMRAE